VAAFLLWLLMLAYHVGWILAEIHPVMPYPIDLSPVGYKWAFTGFLLANGLFFERLFKNIEKLHVSTLLWRQFITGMGGIAIVMLITFANRTTGRMAAVSIYQVLTALYFCLALWAMVVFFMSAVFIFRRFILYPRTRRKVTLWRIFMVFLGLGLVYQLVPMGLFAAFSYLPFFIVVILLSANVRWISYLNFNQKLRALGLFALIGLVATTYLIAGVRLPVQLGIDLEADFLRPDFIYFTIIFCISYILFAILVLFFNLPTSSLFERKSMEIVSFNKINEAIQSNLDFSEIVNTLLEASITVANARVGWVEIVAEEGEKTSIQNSKRITQNDIFELTRDVPFTHEVLEDHKPLLIRNTHKYRQLRGTQSRYHCLLIVPIMSSNRSFGAVFVANELTDSFEDVTVQSLVSFADQTAIALENAQLIRNSIEVERYQEQLKIAREVQSQLLPEKLPTSESVHFEARSESAQEVGGDYFDVFQTKEGRYKIAIGDVSGKGTEAAFYMAEIKGIFHALTRLDLNVCEFTFTANQALSTCLKKGSFITLTYLELDTQARKFEMLRAGHCPSFFFHAETQEVETLSEGGMGLGILRTDAYRKFSEKSETLTYKPGDMLVLYTDGVHEARNASGEEYGYDRLKAQIQQHHQLSPGEMADAIIQSVRDFAQTDPQDDYTLLIIRFS